MSDSIYVGKRVQSFESSPRFAEYDMVVLNIDENTYVSSPYVTIDDTLWSSATNGIHTFTYDGTVWTYNGSTYTTAQLLSEFGITPVYSATTSAKDGDTITVSKTTADDEVTVSAEIARSGQVLECNCPLVKASQRQDIADALLAKVYGFSYQPYQASGARINPAAEIGDAMTSYGTYGGIYQQSITFSRLMASSIGAPSKEEEDDELAYESETERRYARRFADISAEFAIQADSISAKVSKTGGSSSSFAWELEEDHFSVISNGTTMLYIDSTGSTFSGIVKANSIAAGTITINGSSVYAGYISGSQIGSHTIGGGNVGWSTLEGDNISDYTVAVGNLVSSIGYSLDYANYSNSVFSGVTQASYLMASYVSAGDQLIVNGYDAVWQYSSTLGGYVLMRSTA